MNSMQLYVQPQSSPSDSATPRFVSRIFSDSSGRQFRLTFLVAVVNGELRGRLISAQPISASASSNRQIAGDTCEANGSICLPITCSQKEPATEYVSNYTPVVSPYTELYFFMSQPTRAPSYK